MQPPKHYIVISLSSRKPHTCLSPLPAGWTEHKAPTGHTYYYNASTGVSTYTRPLDAVTSFMQHQAVPAINLSDPNVANAFMAQYNAPPPAAAQHNQRHDQGPRRPPPQPKDKPKSKVPIPGHEPWLLVYTKYGRRFAYNPVKNASYWRIPEKLLPAVVEIDKARILEKSKPTGANEGDKVLPKKESDKAEVGAQRRPAASAEPTPAQPDDDKGYDSSEYEEVEVTDDEGEDGDHDEEGHARKRQRTDEPDQPAEEAPVEFTEADIAAQLAAMEADYAQDDEYMDEEDDETPQLSELDARALFKDLLDDFGINPYSPWEKLIEEGKVFSDARYTVLTSTRARKEVWEEWCRERIAQLKELRAKQEKQDPRIPYMAFLAEKATPKLYWPEFRRKYRQEPIMRDSKLTDKDREKWYREHISRLKLPQSTLKADLRKLLESVGLQELNNQTRMERLPGKLLGDVRWISLDAKTRDPIVEAYIQSLRGPPEDGEQTGEEEEGAKKAREEKERRERALRERERAVAEEKRQKEKQLAYGRAQLREEERELERAMQVGKRGLQSQLDAGRGERPNDR
ncbi:hypothetical protein DL546_008848 [Coniochaeta pulveracea]|uniref:WW domain-containing protein n=1 Tax=Coniochaeta pulveracea TaxID=177199 RepID=A0A420YMP8_9PEZI|nr:hypothetical protein DL546_008848 [Coniochaeta pulveracea]